MDGYVITIIIAQTLAAVLAYFIAKGSAKRD